MRCYPGAAFLWLQEPPIPPMPVRMLPVCASAVRALQENVSVGEEKNTRFALHRAVPLYRVLPKLSPMVKELPPVTAAQQQRFLLEGMAPYRKKDAYGAYTICNIYYDTGDWRLIRKSLEKPVYKEKLRVRSYGVPTGGRQGVCGAEEEVRRRGVQAPRRHDRRTAVFQKRIG